MRAERSVTVARLALLAAFVGIWQVSAGNPDARFYLGSPREVLQALWEKTVSGELPNHLSVTGLEVLAGFALGVTTGTVFGFTLWWSPFVSRVLAPYVLAVSAIPVFAFAPLVIVWFGIGYWMKVAIVAFATFFTSLEQSYRGAMSVRDDEQLIFTLLGASRFQLLRFGVFPASVAWVLASFRQNIGCAVLGAFIGEFISADRGIGYFMVRSGSLYDIPSVIAGAAYLGLLTAMLHLILQKLESRRFQLLRLIAVPKSSRDAALAPTADLSCNAFENQHFLPK